MRLAMAALLAWIACPGRAGAEAAGMTATSRDPRLVALFVAESIVLDGRFDETAWAKAEAAGPFVVLGSDNEPANPATRVKALTDGTNLFLGIQCEELHMKHLVEEKRPHDGAVFLDDSVEVFLDPTNERRALVHLACSVSGDRFDTTGTIRGAGVAEEPAWNGDWHVATSKGEKGWIAEWRIPLRDLRVAGASSSLSPPTSMGITLCRTRPRGERDYSSWPACDARFCEPGNMGELILSDAAGHHAAIEFPRDDVFLTDAALPPLRVENRFAVRKRVRIDWDVQGPSGVAKSGRVAGFDVTAGGTRDAELAWSPTLPGSYCLRLRMEDDETGLGLCKRTVLFEVRPPMEVILNPRALYRQRVEATVRLRLPVEKTRPGTLFVGVVRETDGESRRIVSLKAPAAETVPVDFSTTGWSAGNYRVQAEFRSGDGGEGTSKDGDGENADVLASASSAAFVYSPNPEVGFTKDGFLKVDGAPFFPVGMYTLQSDRAGLTDDAVMAEARAAGFNMTVLYAFQLDGLRTLMEAAARNGLRAFVYASNPYEIRTGEWRAEGVMKDATERASYPALLGWYLVDEPEGIGETSAPTVRRFYETVKRVDADHPCSLVIMSGEAAHLYRDGADVVWVDPYPVPEMPVTYVSKTIDAVRRAVDEDTPVWAVLQSFDWSVWRKGALDGEHRPTAVEERCMTYLALVHGAKGIIYWAHTTSKYRIRDYPEHWAGMKRLAGELRDLSPVLLSVEAVPSFSATPASAPIDAMVKRYEGNVYLFAVNREPVECEASFALDGVDAAGSAEALFESRTLRVTGGVLRDAFDPLAVHVYRMKGEKEK